MKLNRTFESAADLPPSLPLFPVSGALLLPRRPIQLTVFEPRYLGLLDDALSGDRLIGMIQPKAGDDAVGPKPELCEIGCLGRVVQFAEIGDGRCFLSLMGVTRFRLAEELSTMTPYRIVRADYAQEVRLYGRVENVFDDRGNSRPRWVGTKTILGVPHDIPVAGYGTKTVNLLRLWASKATEDFDLAAFNSGGYVEAVHEKAVGETISKVLYPNDKTENGRELRLVQQYFFVSCSLRDILRRHFRNPVNTWANFADKVAVQLNDTHPTIAVVELMRILLDEHTMTWDAAWSIVSSSRAWPRMMSDPPCPPVQVPRPASITCCVSASSAVRFSATSLAMMPRASSSVRPASRAFR